MNAVMGGAEHAGAAAALGGLGGLLAVYVGARAEGHGEASFGGRYVFGVEMVRWMCEGGLEDGLVDKGRCWMWKEEEGRTSVEDLFICWKRVLGVIGLILGVIREMLNL